ncbi:MAG: bifunctional nuclease family protein [Methanolinea sp.]|nr:bifunctional nuclease family protein [Methanolinea sp.]
MATGPLGASPAVILSLPEGEMCIPIYIGLWEAISIRNALKREIPPRPLTHDLFVEFMKSYGIVLKEMVIDSLEDGVYYARLIFLQDHHQLSMDCRPSDGIALSLRCNADLLVDPDVVTCSSVSFADLSGLQDLDTYLGG